MGLIYRSSDSGGVITALRTNLAHGQTVVAELADANAHLVGSLEGGELAGEGYAAARSLFEDQVGSALAERREQFDSIRQDVDSYVREDERVSRYGVLKEDELNTQLEASRAMKAATENLIEVNVAVAGAVSVVPALGESLQLLNRRLEMIVDQLERTVRSMEERLTALHAFDAATRGLFQQTAHPQLLNTGGGTSSVSAIAFRTKPSKRADLDQVLREYQVRDDPDGMVEWQPSGLSAIIAEMIGMMPDKTSMTAAEAELLDRIGPTDHQAFNDIRIRAFDAADERYPSESQNDDHNDAFRHAYWNALLSREFGADWARTFTTAHEALPGNEAVREAMDLYNNQVGRKIQVEHPFASQEQLAELVAEAMEEGRLVVVAADGVSLEWSDRVPFGGAGTVPKGAEKLPGRDPDDLVVKPDSGSGT